MCVCVKLNLEEGCKDMGYFDTVSVVGQWPVFYIIGETGYNKKLPAITRLHQFLITGPNGLINQPSKKP